MSFKYHPNQVQTYVLGFMFDDSKENVVLIEKIKPVEHKGLLNGVGGKCEFGIGKDSDHTDTVVREFKEETGVLTKKKDWTYYASISHNDFIIYCYFGANSKYFDKAKTVEKEEVTKRHVDMIARSECVNHMKWLVEMARAYNPNGDKSFAVVDLWG